MSGMPLAGGQSSGVVKKYQNQCTHVTNNRVGANHWNSAVKASKFSVSPTESHYTIDNTLPEHVVAQRRRPTVPEHCRTAAREQRPIPVYGGCR